MSHGKHEKQTSSVSVEVKFVPNGPDRHQNMSATDAAFWTQGGVGKAYFDIRDPMAQFNFLHGNSWARSAFFANGSNYAQWIADAENAGAISNGTLPPDFPKYNTAGLPAIIYNKSPK